jgi:thiamine-monophosphate kinase
MTVSSSKRQPAWITRFYQGLLALAAREKVTLAGGDLSESPSLAFADIIVLGVASRGRALLRSTAKAGDFLYVTGVLGGAAAELERLENWHAPGKRTGRPLPQPRPDSYLDQRAGEAHPHFYPQPRVAVGQALLRRGLATSCIDISDGLSTDLLHLCEESSLSAEVDASAIPLATSAHGTSATLDQALHGGDDYELLFTAPADTRMPRQLAGIPIHPIGRMLAKRRGPRITLLNQNSGKPKRTPLHPQGWQHF